MPLSVVALPGLNGLKTLSGAPFTAKLGLLIIALYLLAALFAPLLSPFGEARSSGHLTRPGVGKTCWEPIRLVAIYTVVFCMAPETRLALPWRQHFWPLSLALDWGLWPQSTVAGSIRF